MKIKINNWEKYNPRKDVKRPSWFPLSIDWVLDPTFYSFTHCERLAWIYLLSTAKKESNPEISVNFDHAVKAANIPENELKSSIEKLKVLGVVTVCASRGRHADVTRTSRTRDADVTRTSRTRHATLQYSTLQNSTEQCRTEPKVENIQTQLPVLQSKPVLQNASATKLFSPKNQFELIDAVPPDQLALWDALYTDREFLERETIKAFQYYKNNPKKTPKTIRGWRAALSSWFERGWVRHVTKIKSVSKNGSICGISYDV